MKKVRFETPDKFNYNTMNESECHSPRPFIEPQICSNVPNMGCGTRIVPFSNDPVQRFECSNSSPYPLATRTVLPNFTQQGTNGLLSNELDLSVLDTSMSGLRHLNKQNKHFYNAQINMPQYKSAPVLNSIENKNDPPNVLTKNDNFFIRRENIHRFKFDSSPLDGQFNCLGLDKENNPLNKKAELVNWTRFSSSNVQKPPNFQTQKPPQASKLNMINSCQCHHCEKIVHNTHPHQTYNQQLREAVYSPCQCVQSQPRVHCYKPNYQPAQQTCVCNHLHCGPPNKNVDKKNWIIERYEQSRKSENMEVEKQTNISKEKREPTVSDLFKIIKLQNEQLQMLQEKVDKFISANTQNTKEISERVVETVTNEHKISIGVMTSFEMVRTSTVINKEIVTQAKENSQVQCNRSQMSSKEIVEKAQPVNLNFLDGIAPVAKPAQATQNCEDNQLNDDKTLNEFSLYNVQVDNATTPMISPEHSMYLDVRDYSDSDASSDERSNVGWTYYNKVMTQVNGMLQDSDMPSSASALYRNASQQCLQMQIDKTNVSVTKRVKFGDDPLGIHQPHIYAATTDTSLKMNQLAAKYLKQTQPQFPQRQPAKQVLGPDVFLGTKNYMEHRFTQETQRIKSPPLHELPKFLDITALKQQPKLL